MCVCVCVCVYLCMYQYMIHDKSITYVTCFEVYNWGTEYVELDFDTQKGQVSVPKQPRSDTLG